MALKLRDIRSVYKILDQVKQLGADAERWPIAALSGIREVLKAKSVCAAVVNLPPPGSDEPPTTEHQYAVGFKCADEHQRMARLSMSGAMGAHPYFAKIAHTRSRFATVVRHDVLSDDEWYGHPKTEEYFLSFGVDHFVHSQFAALSLGKLVALMAYRSVGEPAYGRRERQMLRLIHLELARMWQVELAVPDHVGVRDLTPRQKQVLWMICGGDTEKEISSKLGISHHTVHDHAKAIYKHFEVSSRAQLIAKVLRASETNQTVGRMTMPAEGHYGILGDDDQLSRADERT